MLFRSVKQMSCENCEKNNRFQEERDQFNERNQKSQNPSNGDDLRKVEHPERFDFFGGNDHN